MRTIRITERRARLGLRHRLAPSARSADPAEVARSLVALHATDAATVHLAAAARMTEPSVAAVERALYDERTLLRMLGMRRTVFVVPDEVAPVVQAACTAEIEVRERRVFTKHLAEAGIAPDQAAAEVWLKEVEDETAEALKARGSANASQLGEDVPRLRSRLELAPGKKYAATPMVTNRVLAQLAAQGRIVRGRPRGSWLSSQYSWAPVERWIPGGLRDIPPDEARAALAGAWLRAFGPATLTDLRWWAGWTAAYAKQALAAIGAVSVELEDGSVGFVLPDDVDPVDEPEPWVALLPALDPTPMGWKERQWYVGDHTAELFDTSGNIGPTVWSDGRIVGVWGQPPSAQVVTVLFEGLPKPKLKAISDAAAALTDWLGGVRVTPRFRTPVERDIADTSPG